MESPRQPEKESGAESGLGSRSSDPDACPLPCASWLLGAGTDVPILLLLQMLFLELNAVLKYVASG